MVRWLDDFAKADLAPRTYHNYKLQIREHIVPAFGTMKLSKLDTPNIQALYSAKLHDGLKPSSVRYIHAVLHRALSKAVELRLIARNPAASAASQGAPRRGYAAKYGSNACIPRCRPRAEVRSPLRPVSDVRAQDGWVFGFEVVGHQPRSGDAASEPPAPTHKGRRRARLQRTQERFQADHRLAPEGPRSPQDSSHAAGRGEALAVLVSKLARVGPQRSDR